MENTNKESKSDNGVSIITEEDYNEYRRLLHEKDKAVAKVSFEFTESALNKLNEIIDQLMDFRSKHAVV